jgi:fragile X mental retardation protein
MLSLHPFSIFCITGSRHQTPDTADERVRDLPPRQHQYQTGPRPNTHPSRQPLRRDHHRDERRRMTDEEDTVMDSQDVSSVDRGELHNAVSVTVNIERWWAEGC